MGAAFSRQPTPEEKEIKDLEAYATASGVLPMLEKAFSNLARFNPDSGQSAKFGGIPASNLEECLNCRFLKLESKDYAVSAEMSKLLSELGPTIVSTFFTPEAGQVSWLTLMRGYDKCCKRTTVSLSISLLFRLFHKVRQRADIPSNLEFRDSENDDKIDGHFKEDDICIFLWFCWVMEHNARSADLSDKEFNAVGIDNIELPEIKSLVRSAMAAFSGSELQQLQKEESNETGTLNIEIPAQNLFSWILATIPGLAHCLPQYVLNALKRTSPSTMVAAQTSPKRDEVHVSDLNKGDSGQVASQTSSKRDEVHVSDLNKGDSGLLSSGMAWAIALSFRPSLGGEALMTSFMSVSHSRVLPDLIYRSSSHGKGMNRFWSKVEGYNGPLLILISGSSTVDEIDELLCRRWIIGAFTSQGFENKDTYYGSSGCLFAVKPIFRCCFPTGHDKNFVYSHLHPLGRVYEPHPKPVGIAFGGTLGNERVFLDEDFSKVTIRHHVIDKTYHGGSLVPGQEYSTLEASVLDVEVWGLGGKVAEQQQAMYKQREQLFTEQRRKVDLKTFGNWEDSPEKMMMDLMSNPNRVEREDR